MIETAQMRLRKDAYDELVIEQSRLTLESKKTGRITFSNVFLYVINENRQLKKELQELKQNDLGKSQGN